MTESILSHGDCFMSILTSPPQGQALLFPAAQEDAALGMGDENPKMTGSTGAEETTISSPGLPEP